MLHFISMILFAAIKILWYKKGKMDGNDIFYSVEEKYFKRKIIQIIRMWYKSVTSKDIQLILYFFGETKNFSLSKKKKKRNRYSRNICDSETSLLLWFPFRSAPFSQLKSSSKFIVQILVQKLFDIFLPIFFSFTSISSRISIPK